MPGEDQKESTRDGGGGDESVATTKQPTGDAVVLHIDPIPYAIGVPTNDLYYC